MREWIQILLIPLSLITGYLLGEHFGYERGFGDGLETKSFEIYSDELATKPGYVDWTIRFDDKPFIDNYGGPPGTYSPPIDLECHTGEGPSDE